jgi:hypothetical protein
MPFYVKNLKDPDAGVRIMRQKMPVKKWESMSGHNMPFNAKMMSAGTGDFKTLNNAVTAGELSPGAAKRLSVNAPIESDWEEINFNPRLINLSELSIIFEKLGPGFDEILHPSNKPLVPNFGVESEYFTNNLKELQLISNAKPEKDKIRLYKKVKSNP